MRRALLRQVNVDWTMVEATTGIEPVIEVLQSVSDGAIRAQFAPKPDQPRGEKTLLFAQNLGGEGEIRTHGTLVQRFSSLGQGVRGGSLMTRFTRESTVCRASNPLMFGSVATG